jgi:hypothetical protein
MSWAEWRDQFAKACDGSHYTIEALEHALLSGKLYPLFGDGCCYLVEIVSYPTETACQIMWAAGDLDAVLSELPKVEAWAKAQGCSEMLVEGRAGWARALRNMNYRPWSVTVRKGLR